MYVNFIILLMGTFKSLLKSFCFSTIFVLSTQMGLIVICTYVVGSLPNSSFKRRMNKRVSMFCFDFLSGALSLVCCYHNKDNVPRQGICVANHTSPMDVLVLACDNTYDMVSFYICFINGN